MPKKKTPKPKARKAAKKKTTRRREDFGQAVRIFREATKDYPP